MGWLLLVAVDHRSNFTGRYPPYLQDSTPWAPLALCNCGLQITRLAAASGKQNAILGMPVGYSRCDLGPLELLYFLFTLLLSIFTLLYLPSYIYLSYFILAVPMRKCLQQEYHIFHSPTECNFLPRSAITVKNSVSGELSVKINWALLV